MSKQREALQLALNALEKHGNSYLNHEDEYSAAKDAIREALAEPEKTNQCGETCERAKLCVVCADGVIKNEPEPVAWVNRDELDNMLDDQTAIIVGQKDNFHKTPLYTAPPARKPLTDYQIRQIDELVWKELTYEEKTLGQFALKMARAIEKAHGIGEQ